jgi:NAD(P)-dependent dehydrogenase (short-subunit alcohol dehydrogenase family)
MKIIVLGASGTIGSAIVSALGDHEVVTAGSRSGDVRVVYTSKEAVWEIFETVGNFDGLVCAVGDDGVFKPYKDLTDADFEVGFQRKFLARMRLVRTGIDYVSDGGSFTLSSGFLSHYPFAASVAIGPFNAAVDSCVRSAAPLLPRGIRLNVVSPAPVVPEESVRHGLVSAAQSAQAYAECVEGDFTGRVVRAWGGLEKEPIW